MIINKYYKYLIKPDIRQKQIIDDTFAAVNFVHNCYLSDLEKGIRMEKRAVDIAARYKKEYPFLKQIDGSAIMNEIFHCQDAGKKHRRYRSENESMNSYCTANLPKSPVRILNGEYLCVTKLGKVKMAYSRPIPEKAVIKAACIMCCPDGKYYASILIAYEKKKETYVIDPDKSIGIDYSSPHFFVDDKGNRVDMPHYFEESEKRIHKEIKKLHRMVKGSNNYKKQKLKIAKIHAHVKNQRMDFLHKLSSDIANRYDVVCMEDLNMEQIASRFSLAKRTYDNAFGIFQNLLKYKMEEQGKKILYTDRYYPSSKTCGHCGYINNGLRIDERIWICPGCGMIHDRDVNAAKNIRKNCLERYYGRRVSG